MKRLGVLLLTLEWDGNPSQGTQHEMIRRITTTPCGMVVHHRVPSMKRLGVLLPLPPSLEWDASASEGTKHEATRGIALAPRVGW